MQIFLYPPLNVISRLLLSNSAGPKVIIISGFHSITKKVNVLGFWTFTGVLNTTHIFGMKNYFCPQM